MSEAQTPYRVLARKYRPQNFEELIGQEALVRTLTNAIESGRIAHAFMLTGVRGVGKTTTARIIAKALNYKGPDGTSGPTTGDTADCQLCQAISEDRHPDVIEMDAASRTGVEDIREILDGVRYAPSEARYKIYIIDEVHMLSKNAFNALLKTLEEPPEHVKFIFATTEIRKVPITVLSRCQRFDLRRVDGDTLEAHFKNICENEAVEAEGEALSIIARAADGSVRDGLSLLDQAMAPGDKITAAQVQDMLGLGDRARSLDLLEKALSGSMPEALAIMDDLYKSGADPVQLVQDLLDFTHILSRLKAVPEAKDMKYSIAPDEVTRAADMAAQMSMPTLGKTWQILLKGLPEVQNAPNAQSAAEMVIIRLAYAADLPDPADLIKRLKEEGASNAPASATPASSPAPAPAQSAPAAPAPAPAMTEGRGGAPVTGENAPPPVPEDTVSASLAAYPNAGREQPTHASPGPSSPLPMSHHVKSNTGVETVSGEGNAAALRVVKTEAKTEAQNNDGETPRLDTLEAIVAFLEARGEMILASHVFHHVHLVEIKPQQLDIRLGEKAPEKLSQDLKNALTRHTAQNWMVVISSAPGAPTLAALKQEADNALREEVLAHPDVRAIFELFPGAELIEIETESESENP